LGGDVFVEAMGRLLRAQKPGPKKRESGN